MLSSILPFLGKIKLSTYLKAGATLIVLMLILGLKCQVNHLDKQRKELQTTVDTLSEANTAQTKAISTLESQRIVDAETVRKLFSDVVRIGESDRITRRSLAEVEKKNEDARKYLSIPVPPALQRVLSEEPNPSGDN